MRTVKSAGRKTTLFRNAFFMCLKAFLEEKYFFIPDYALESVDNFLQPENQPLKF